MTTLSTQIGIYLKYCKSQKRLDEKTIKAYRIDLRQFAEFTTLEIGDITPDILENYIAGLHQKYQPKTAKRKIASLKALFHYFEYKELIQKNPFHRCKRL